MYLLNLCIEFLHLCIEFVFIILNSCIEFMFENSCTYYFLVHVLNIFDIKIVFIYLFIFISRQVFCYIHFMT